MVGDMAQPLSVLAALKKDLSSVPNTHIEWHTTICNSRSRIWYPVMASLDICMYILTFSHSHSQISTHNVLNLYQGCM